MFMDAAFFAVVGFIKLEEPEFDSSLSETGVEV